MQNAIKNTNKHALKPLWFTYILYTEYTTLWSTIYTAIQTYKSKKTVFGCKKCQNLSAGAGGMGSKNRQIMNFLKSSLWAEGSMGLQQFKVVNKTVQFTFRCTKRSSGKKNGNFPYFRSFLCPFKLLRLSLRSEEILESCTWNVHSDFFILILKVSYAFPQQIDSVNIGEAT
jgi:hypothetical protein